MIATNKRDGQSAMRLPPALEQRDGSGLHASSRMNQIAEHQQLFGTGLMQKHTQSIESGAGAAVRNRHTVRAKRRGLAPVHVGDDQYPRIGQVERLIGKEIDGNVGKGNATVHASQDTR